MAGLLFLLCFSLIILFFVGLLILGIALGITYHQQNDSHHSQPSDHTMNPAVVKTLQKMNQLSDQRSRREWQMKTRSEEYLRKVHDITRS